MLGKKAKQRQLDILNKLNMEHNPCVWCEDELTSDHKDLLEAGFIEKVEKANTCSLLSIFNPKAFIITVKGRNELRLNEKG